MAKQVTARVIDPCEVTKSGDFLNGGENRLDTNVLAGLQSNPYNISINPMKAIEN
jgi:hypothetical protein